MSRLAGKVAIVTGGGSGIGRATAVLFAREGAKVVVADAAAENGEAVTREIVAAGGAARFVATDVTRSEDVKAMVAFTLEAFGRVDVLFNNAGISGPIKPIDEYSEDAWHEVIAVDLTSVFLGIRHVVPPMAKQGGGVILSTASVAGLVGWPGSGAYGAAKAGVVNLTRIAALDLAAKGIRVNCICPGVIDTPMGAPVTKNPSTSLLKSLSPVGRYGAPEDIANAALFLASDESSFATGAPFVIDGGLTAR